jgi:hypothetical protein
MVISLELKVLYSRVNEEEEGRGGGRTTEDWNVDQALWDSIVCFQTSTHLNHGVRREPTFNKLATAYTPLLNKLQNLTTLI